VSPSDLIALITEKARELENYPRMNRHCVDWFDRYSNKHDELQQKFAD